MSQLYITLIEKFRKAISQITEEITNRFGHCDFKMDKQEDGQRGGF